MMSFAVMLVNITIHIRTIALKINLNNIVKQIEKWKDAPKQNNTPPSGFYWYLQEDATTYISDVYKWSVSKWSIAGQYSDNNGYTLQRPMRYLFVKLGWLVRLYTEPCVVHDCIEPVGNGENRAVFKLSPNSGLDEIIRLQVNRSCSFIQDQDPGFP